MTPFLKQVANHYYGCSSPKGSLVFVMPSQRAVVFFRKYFAEAVRENAGQAVFAPQVMSIDDFFSCLSPLKKVDSVLLLLRLYDCYREVAAEKAVPVEDLDKFIFWGNVILSDFSDVDKYLVNAADLFRNVSQYKDMQDDYSDLSEIQKSAIREFLGNFETDGEYKRRFASTWNLLGPLYELFNRRLREEGIAYEGSLYRSIVGEVETLGAGAVLERTFPDCGKVVFCGLNALNECEKRILGRLRDLSLAEFCWDYVSEWIRDPHNKSSFFLSDNIQTFPQAFPLEKCDRVPGMEVIQVPSAVGQTKLLTDLLSSEEIPSDERTAILLPDESLLLPLLNSIPERVGNVNVTMGFPMTSSSFFSLMDDISQLQLHIRWKGGSPTFYHRYVWSIVGNNVFEALCDDTAKSRIAAMKKAGKYYVPASEINGTPLLDMVFRTPLSENGKGNDNDNAPLAGYITDILNFIGGTIARDGTLKRKFSLELDFAMEYVKTVNLLASRQVPVPVATWLRMLKTLLQAKSIPFKGEPLHGLQIMGPLEIRALDFDRLFILSCNEAVFPRKSSASSFIPPLLRRGFSLPTYEYQDAVWAYYFYRMIQRPSKVYMILDSRTEGLKSGEESRYVKQLEYHYRATLTRKTADSVPHPTSEEQDIRKTGAHIEFMHNNPLSASAIKQYLSCPAKFYYSFLEGLEEEEEVAESLDAGMTGNVFHRTMQEIFKRHGSRVTVESLEAEAKDREGIRSLVEKHIMKEMNTDSIHGRDLVVSELIQKYVRGTLERDIELLRNAGRGWFDIYGLEKKVTGTIGKFSFKGFIDRLDSYADGQVRIVDYKTGSVRKEDTGIDDSNAVAIADEIFNPSSKKRAEIALQFFIYDYLLEQEGKYDGKTMVNSVYSTRTLLQEAPENVRRNDTFYKRMSGNLVRLLEELENPEFDFRHTDNKRNCEFCKFRTVCGR